VTTDRRRTRAPRKPAAKPAAKRTPRKRAPRAKVAEAVAEAAPPSGGEQAASAPAPTVAPAATEPEPGHEPEIVDASTAWTRVMRAVGSIAKGDRNTDQGFNFRGIDATMNTVGPALRTHGAMVLPVGVEILESERYESKRGAQMHGMVTRHEWLILGPDGGALTYPDGSPIIMRTLGQAADTSDKVASKASSVAYRTLLLQSLTVPTGDRDPDADTHERAAERPADPRAPLWSRIKELGTHAGANPAAMAKHYLEKMGHAIDGPDATPEKLQEYIDRLEAHYATQRAAQAAEGSQDPDDTPADEPATLPEEGGHHRAAEEESTPEPETVPPAASEPEPTEPAPPATATPAAPSAPVQGDPRQALWDAILATATAARWTIDQARADFRAWSADAAGHPIEIDGAEATPELLTRYAHVIKARVADGGA
jgi:hypothetical protein